MSHHLVVVESPAKAKTIEKYLGKDYTVLASYGHVRDLPSKNGSVDVENNFAMKYEVDADSKKKIAALTAAAKGIDTLYLATDPDREGEAISWHVLEALLEKKAIKKDTPVKRIAFNAITKSAVTKAITEPREIDMDLVNAQQARRALDYLVGFTLSPVLWRKLPGSRSAGRVQSVALRLICEREGEIEIFKNQEYWDITTQLSSGGISFDAKLSVWEGNKLKKFDISNEAQANAIANHIQGQQTTVISVDEKESRRNPYAPFITSTLQMDASRKLGFGAKQTMQVAQKLYEQGLITYMRTDGVTVAPEAIAAARDWITKEHGAAYLPEKPRFYSSKAKNAQEAHEAIRPTDMFKTPKASGTSGEQFKLYDLIWKRMLASQMNPAVFDQVAVDFETADKKAILHATGSVMKFDGFLALYIEGKDDDDDSDNDNDRRLPPLKIGTNLAIEKTNPAQHFTQPPPRYTEASLVKRLEELGIGRPSTYAAILAVLIDRGYVNLDKKRFTPEARGRIVSAFLESFFARYVEYDFTAQIEEKLDLVSDGKLDWKDLLRDWWKDFIIHIEAAKEVPNPQILEEVDRQLIPFLYGIEKPVAEARKCPNDGGDLSLKTGKFGAFLGCSNYPECKFTKPVASESDEADESIIALDGPQSLGVDTETNTEVFLKKGPYGFYVQLGEDAKGEKPKRASLPKGMMPEEMKLTRALELLALPRDVGLHPETKQMITAAIGRFGPYLKHQGKFTSINAEDDVYTIGINRAVAVIEEKKSKGFGPEALKNLGEHPDDGAAVEVMKGRYGAYVKHGKTNATLPKDITPDTITMEQALELIAAKAKSPPKKKPAAKKKATAKKKPAAKKAAAKKPAAKKAPSKK